MAGDNEKPNSNTGVGGDKKIGVFYLGSNDNTGNLITPIQLKGENYDDEWSRAIQTAKWAKRKFGFLDGRIKKPKENDENLDDWYTVHSMLVAWLMNTIEPSIRSTLTFYKDAFELWTVTKGRFRVINDTQIFQLKTFMAECKQGKTKSFASCFWRRA